MLWHYLGHAMWLASVGELRILFDPLLDNLHHGGIFEVSPPRELDVAALRPDFIVVSHRHPDHFDVASLARLAEHDADSVVLTSDPLVEQSARRVGFRSVARVDEMHRVTLTGAELLTTPSFGDELEWGVMVASDDGVVWNQIDSVHRDVADVRDTIDKAASVLERPRLRERIELGLVRWQPLLEVNVALARRPGFPFEAYRDVLEQVAALSATAVVPVAAGARHVATYDHMNRYVYPVSERRFLGDVRARCAGTEAWSGVMGGLFRVQDGVSTPDGRSELVREVGEPAAERFVPLALPELVDPNPHGRDEEMMRPRVCAWLEQQLLPALERAYAGMGAAAPLRLSLEVVYPSARDCFTFVLRPEGARLMSEGDDDYDVLNQLAGSQLLDVIEGRSQWGDLLLAGQLRASDRAYVVDADGMRRANVAPLFLYYALSYEESVERAVEWQLTQLGAG